MMGTTRLHLWLTSASWPAWTCVIAVEAATLMGFSLISPLQQKRASAGELLEDGTDDGTRSLRDDRSVLTASSSQYTRSGRLTRARRAELIEVCQHACTAPLVGDGG